MCLRYLLIHSSVPTTFLFSGSISWFLISVHKFSCSSAAISFTRLSVRHFFIHSQKPQHRTQAQRLFAITLYLLHCNPKSVIYKSVAILAFPTRKSYINYLNHAKSPVSEYMLRLFVSNPFYKVGHRPYVMKGFISICIYSSKQCSHNRDYVSVNNTYMLNNLTCCLLIS